MLFTERSIEFLFLRAQPRRTKTVTVQVRAIGIIALMLGQLTNHTFVDRPVGLFLALRENFRYITDDRCLDFIHGKREKSQGIKVLRSVLPLCITLPNLVKFFLHRLNPVGKEYHFFLQLFHLFLRHVTINDALPNKHCDEIQTNIAKYVPKLTSVVELVLVLFLLGLLDSVLKY